MRRSILLHAAGLLVLLAACATAGDGASQPRSDEDAGTNSVPEASTPDAAADGGVPEDGAPRPTLGCSKAGWCPTLLPDDDLTLKDVWPFDERAFAVAESDARGVKILEWVEANEAWSYIDDDTQNAFDGGQYAGKIWAPSENEVYYTVAPAFVYHGTRSNPTSPWSWQRSRLPDNSHDDPARDHGIARYILNADTPASDYAALGVWGTSADDVYAWYANTIFRWTSVDGEPASWVAELVLDDAENPGDTFFVFSASASGPDDVWFGAGRARHDATGMYPCPVAIRKTPDGYRTVVDHVVDDASDPMNHHDYICRPRPDVLGFEYGFEIPDYGVFYTEWMMGGLLTSIQSAGPGAAIGISGGSVLAYIPSAPDGQAVVNPIDVTIPKQWPPPVVNSLWLHGAEAWMSGWGLVLRTPNDPAAWSKGLGLYPDYGAQPGAATFSISTVDVGAGALDLPLHQIRGTSNTNLWAIGPRHALHKTTL